MDPENTSLDTSMIEDNAPEKPSDQSNAGQEQLSTRGYHENRRYSADEYRSTEPIWQKNWP